MQVHGQEQSSAPGNHSRTAFFHLPFPTAEREERESRESGVGGSYGLGVEVAIITLTTCHYLTLNLHGHSS